MQLRKVFVKAGAAHEETEPAGIVCCKRDNATFSKPHTWKKLRQGAVAN
jgi:hypothetical protein